MSFSPRDSGDSISIPSRESFGKVEKLRMAKGDLEFKALTLGILEAEVLMEYR